MVDHSYLAERAGESSIPHTIASDPDMQRGRKRRRSPPDLQREDTQHVSEESSTFRGRARHRSTSRFDSSRGSSRMRGGSLSPTRKKMLYFASLHRRRDQSPSRSRSPTALDASKRRRQRSRSRTRDHCQSRVAYYASIEQPSLLRHQLPLDEIIASSEEVLLSVQHTG